MQQSGSVLFIMLRSQGALAMLLCLSASAQTAGGPEPLALPAPIVTPRDVAMPGVIRLAVDVTDTAHKIFAVHETMPVAAAGPLVLLFPKWETGSHAPTGSVANLAGLKIKAGSKTLEWKRDAVEVFAFHIVVPPDTVTIDIDFEYLSPRSGAMLVTRDIVIVPWQDLILYPAGFFARDMAIQASLTLPDQFRYASALETEHADASSVLFKMTSLETLTDSPVYAGRFFQRLELASVRDAAVFADLVGDAPADLDITPDEMAKLRALVTQTVQLFGSRHYAHYDLLVSLSDLLPSSGGIEHLQSGEINLAADFFRNIQAHLLDQSLIDHEFVHSWNGLFRQPSDLWTPNLNTPMRDSLLWVYEGLTEFWARVLSVRSGLVTAEQIKDILAIDAALTENRAGRAWKSLQDSSNDPLYDAGHSVAWRDWQRREDYYTEGVLVWLGVDALIRRQTEGQRSLEDLAQAFFGMDDGSPVTRTYTFEDLCAALGKISRFDWTAYLRERLDTHSDAGLLDALTESGYRLIYTDKPTEAYRQYEEDSGVAADLSFSLGLSVSKTGVVKSVAWNGPAFRAGLGPGVRITAVNGEAFSVEILVASVAQVVKTPIGLTFTQDGQTRNVRVEYKNGLRYPRLERIAETRDGLAALFNAPDTKGQAQSAGASSIP